MVNKETIGFTGIMFISMVSLLAQSNNLVPNHSFEDPEAGITCSDFCQVISVDKAKNWKGIIETAKPVYWNTNCTNCLDCYDGNKNEWGTESAKDGSAYSILPVKFFGAANSAIGVELDEKIKECHKYELKFYISRGEYSTKPENLEGCGSCFEIITGNCAASRIKVKLANSNDWNANGKIIEAGVDVSKRNGWKKVNLVFRGKDAAIGTKYLLFKSAYGRVYNVASKATFLDKISLEDITPKSELCDKHLTTLKPPEISLDEVHTQSDPFSISNLKGIDRFHLVISDPSTQSIVREILVEDHPANTICWDGKDNNGNEVSAGYYEYIFTLSNECDQLGLASNLEKKNGSSNFTDDLDCMIYKPVSRTPKRCCYEHLQISNTTIRHDPTTTGNEIRYVVKNSITAGPNVTIAAGTRAVLQAGNQIDLNQVFDTKQNPQAQLETILKTCNSFIINSFSTKSTTNKIDSSTPPKITKSKTDSFSDTTNYHRKETETKLKVLPNPAKKVLFFKYKLSQSTHVSLTISNLAGEVIACPLKDEKKKIGTHQLRYNISEFPPGVYIYSYSTNNYTEADEIIIIP